MNTLASISRTVHFSNARAVTRQAWQEVLMHLRLGWQTWQRARRLQRDEADFRRLDAWTLRDLGMSSSEHASYWAEAEGLVPQTRQRVRATRHQDGRP